MTQDNDSTKKLVDDIPEEERRTPPKPAGRVEVDDPEEKYGTPRMMSDARIEMEREIFGIKSDYDAIEKFLNDISAEQQKEILNILRQFPVASEETYIEQRLLPATALYIGKMSVRKQYSRRMHGDYDAIMADAQAEIEALTKEDFLGWLEKAKENDIKLLTEEARNLYGEELLDGLLNDDMETAIDWLSERCKPFEYALEEWGQDTQALKRLIYDHVSLWFTVPASEEAKRRYRQAKDAQGIVEKTDGRTPIITHPEYSGALNLGERGNAYLQEYDPSQLPIEYRNKFNIESVDGASFEFENGNLYLSITDEGGRRIRMMSAQLQDLKTGKHIQEIDTGLLKVYFGFLCQARKTDPEIESLWIYVPDLYYELTRRRNVPATSYAHDEDGNILLDEDGNKVVSVKGFKDKIIETIHRDYQNLGGMMYEGGRDPSIYLTLAFLKYDEPENKILLTSPYMNKLYDQMQSNKLKYASTNAKGRTTYLDKPDRTLLADSRLYVQKDKTAIINVETIISVIERGGVGIHDTHIAVKTMIERNALLQARLEVSKNKTRDLQRSFENTYKYLREYGNLQTKYKNIRLPEHPKDTPTAKDYKTKVLHFHHEGQNKYYNEE